MPKKKKQAPENVLATLLDEVAAQPPVQHAPPDDPDNNVWVYLEGTVSCSVCAPAGMEREVIEKQVNAQAPTGLKSKWQISEEKKFSGGEPMPYPCPDVPGRKHWLLHC